jgi:coproporphyrinogen III oxidase-like Fe-S oxidoreductase
VTDTATGSPYEGYVYAYPHKTAYRPLEPRPALRDVWAEQDRSSLFLYLHVPFCEMRCGFCNLFTRTGAPEDLTNAYLDALDRQARDVADEIGPTSFATAAFGGGTPTYLTAGELDRLCDIASRFADLSAVPLAVETSPATATADRLSVLRDRGVTRISIGVQSFIDAEAHAAGRPQKRGEVESALHRIRSAGFAALNIDLIYGIAGQTPASWEYSLDAALAWEPEEIYLYPLYVRPLTGLGRRRLLPVAGTPVPAGHGDPRDDARRLALYRFGRDRLLGAGYEQVSMRMFRLAGADSGAGAGTTRYCCQDDGMVGLGCGARSYTSDLHYSFEYAVEISRVRGIIDDFIAAPEFTVAEVGFRLDDDEQRRRYLLQSLLQAEGTDRAAYRARFGTDALDDFAGPLAPLVAAGWTKADAERIRLTSEGLAWSDAIGPALFSPRVRTLMDGYQAR